jgi:hypothetical protein
MLPPPPPGQGPIDPRGAFAPPPPPSPHGGMGAPIPPPPQMYPPMPMPMPPPYYFAPPASKQGSFARGILMTLATTIFGFSLLLNVYLLFAAGIAGASSGVEQQSLVSGNSKEKVAVVPITGVLDERVFRQFEKLITRAEDDPNVKALVIECGHARRRDHRIGRDLPAHPEVQAEEERRAGRGRDGRLRDQRRILHFVRSRRDLCPADDLDREHRRRPVPNEFC